MQIADRLVRKMLTCMNYALIKFTFTKDPTRSQGCINLEIHFFVPPPPFLIYVFSRNEIYHIEGVRAAGKKIQLQESRGGGRG